MKIIRLTHVIEFLVNLFAQAQDDILLLKLPDGREFVLTAIDRLNPEEENLDEEIQRMYQNPELMQVLRERKSDRSRISLSEARQRLGLDNE